MKKYLRYPVLIFAGLGCTVSLFLLYNVAWSNYVVPVKSHPITYSPDQVKSGLPVRLSIPSIQVDATVLHLGLTDSGEMDAPDNAHDVSWYNLSTKPGEVGSAVMAGHLDWKNVSNGVFLNLDTLKKGDTIYVKNDIGKDLVFIVRETRIYDMDDDATDIFVSNSGIHLNLITCAGRWDISQQKYAKRLVVFSDLVE